MALLVTEHLLSNTGMPNSCEVQPTNLYGGSRDLSIPVFACLPAKTEKFNHPAGHNICLIKEGSPNNPSNNNKRRC